MRLAIKFAYDGTKFTGSQRQLDTKTVEGVIIDCLKEHNVIDDVKNAKFQIGSRTDSGVSALGNVLAVNTDFQKNNVLHILNKKLIDCWFYGIAEVNEGFNPRNALSRWYRYHLFNALIDPLTYRQKQSSKHTLNFKSLRSVIDMFQGTHDFKNFSNPHAKKTIRTIDMLSAIEQGDWIFIDLKARSFLWHQVRRLVNSWVRYTYGELSKTQLSDALNRPEFKLDFGLAPAEPLFLMDIEYDFTFVVNRQLLKKTRNRLMKCWLNFKFQDIFFNYMLKKI